MIATNEDILTAVIWARGVRALTGLGVIVYVNAYAHLGPERIELAAQVMITDNTPDRAAQFLTSLRDVTNTEQDHAGPEGGYRMAHFSGTTAFGMFVSGCCAPEVWAKIQRAMATSS